MRLFNRQRRPLASAYIEAIRDELEEIKLSQRKLVEELGTANRFAKERNDLLGQLVGILSGIMARQRNGK